MPWLEICGKKRCVVNGEKMLRQWKGFVLKVEKPALWVYCFCNGCN